VEIADEKADTADSVFDVIVTVCAERILSRLHLHPSNKQKTKKPIVETLRQAVASLRQLREKISNRRELVNSASLLKIRRMKLSNSLQHGSSTKLQLVCEISWKVSTEYG
jgi:hypothetical protein